MVLDFKALEPLLRWEDTFHTEYTRKRNSRAKTKNIRCFPSCSDAHNSNGFCGRTAVVTLEDFPGVLEKLHIDSKYNTVENLSARATFLTENQYEIMRQQKDIIYMEKEQLLHDTRSALNPRLPFIPVEINWFSEQHITFRINPQLLGWHNVWRSNKSTADTKHVLALFVYIRLENESRYSLLGVSSSPRFVISSKNVIKDQKLGIKEEKGTKRKPIFNMGFASAEPGVLLTRQKVDSKLSEMLQNVAEAKKGLLKQANENETIGIDDDYLSVFLHAIRDDWGMIKSNPDMSSAYEMPKPTKSFDTPSSGACSADITSFSFSDNDKVGMNDIEVIHERITESLKGDALAEELDNFLQECKSGHFGPSVCENLILESDYDTLVKDSFVKSYLCSIITKFNTIFAKKLWNDLYDKGLVLKPWTEAADTADKVLLELIPGYDASLSNSHKKVSVPQFLEMLKRFHSSSEYINSKMNTIDSARDPFAPINKCWVSVDNKHDIWFIDIMSKKLGLINYLVASVMSKVSSEMTLFADHEKVRLQLLPVASYFWSQDIIVDNQVHEMRDPVPLLPYVVKLPKKLYKGRQFYNAAGRYCFQWLVWYKYSEVFSVNELIRRNLVGYYVCMFHEGTVHGQQLSILHRVFHVDVRQDVSNVPLQTWKKKGHQDLVEEITVAYLAK